jgi:hypothetical protein
MRQRKKLLAKKIRLSRLQDQLLRLLEEAGSEELIGAANTLSYAFGESGSARVQEFVHALKGLARVGFISIRIGGRTCADLGELQNVIVADPATGYLGWRKPMVAGYAQILLEEAGRQAILGA